MRRKQQARTAATVHISFWIDGPPGLPLKQTATFRCEEDALRFLQQRKYTGRQHREPRQMSPRRMSASTPEPPTPGQYSSDLAVDTPARSAARAAAAALAAVAAPLVRDLLRKRRRSLRRRARRRRRLRKRVADAAAKDTSDSTEEELEGAAVAATPAAALGEEASEGAAAAATPAADSERKAPEGATAAATLAAGLVAATVATAVPLALSRLAAASAAVGCDPQAAAFALNMDIPWMDPKWRYEKWCGNDPGDPQYAVFRRQQAAFQAARAASDTSGQRGSGTVSLVLRPGVVMLSASRMDLLIEGPGGPVL